VYALLWIQNVLCGNIVCLSVNTLWINCFEFCFGQNRHLRSRERKKNQVVRLTLVMGQIIKGQSHLALPRLNGSIHMGQRSSILEWNVCLSVCPFLSVSEDWVTVFSTQCIFGDLTYPMKVIKPNPNQSVGSSKISNYALHPMFTHVLTHCILLKNTTNGWERACI
jgi:hypothetical protein